MIFWAIVVMIYYGILMTGAIVTGCIFVRRRWPLAIKLLVVQGVFMAGVEYGVLFGAWGQMKDLIYNINMFVETGVITLVLATETPGMSARKICRWLLGVLLLGTAICYCFHPNVFVMNETANMFFLFVTLAASCIVLIDILSSSSDEPFAGRPVFWMAGGMLGYSCIFMILQTLRINSWEITKIMMIPLNLLANSFMYGGYWGTYITLRRRFAMAN